jgi:hypothetical protein
MNYLTTTFIEFLDVELPTVADFFSKPLQGKLFQKFRKAIMGH